ncbi:hypothetical protein A6A08_23205 [Nocardiopsis sp. TSRI0078]|nr:hypothetical protein A6A08_23205 [Nocardiopsis sp. TSRI0078]
MRTAAARATEAATAVEAVVARRAFFLLLMMSFGESGDRAAQRSDTRGLAGSVRVCAGMTLRGRVPTECVLSDCTYADACGQGVLARIRDRSHEKHVT